MTLKQLDFYIYMRIKSDEIALETYSLHLINFIPKYSHVVGLFIALHQRSILGYSSTTYSNPNEKNMCCPSMQTWRHHDIMQQ